MAISLSVCHFCHLKHYHPTVGPHTPTTTAFFFLEGGLGWVGGGGEMGQECIMHQAYLVLQQLNFFTSNDIYCYKYIQ